MHIALVFNQLRLGGPEEAEYDRPETIARIRLALERLGHAVTECEASGPLLALGQRLDQLRPDLVLNMSEGARGRAREAVVPMLLEQLGLPFTGGDAHACVLTLDKGLTRLCVEALGVPVPRGQSLSQATDLDVARFPGRTIVKPQFEGSSKGIDQDSVVSGPGALRALVARQLQRYPEGVVVEEFVDGVDVVVPWLEGARPATGGVLEACGYSFADGARMAHRIYDYGHKQDGDKVEVVCPVPLPERTRAEIEATSLRVVRATGVRHLARLDWRVTPDGRPCFLEINALPSLEEGAAMFVAAERAGLQGMEAFFRHLVAQATSNQTGSLQSGTPL